MDALREQMTELGYVIVSNSRPLTPARKAILQTITPDNQVRLETPPEGRPVDIPILEDPFAQHIIREARKEGLLSSCMWRQVGCVLADPERQIIEARTHNDPVGDKRFCKEMGVSVQELLALMGTDERLEFCHARHAENAMAGLIINQRLEVQDKIIGVSVEPCDHCANFLAGVRPSGVYVDFNPNRRYYNLLGLQILRDAHVPVSFVRLSKS
jgi:deoxycytidylate deaminase